MAAEAHDDGTSAGPPEKKQRTARGAEPAGGPPPNNGGVASCATVVLVKAPPAAVKAAAKSTAAAPKPAAAAPSPSVATAAQPPEQGSIIASSRGDATGPPPAPLSMVRLMEMDPAVHSSYLPGYVKDLKSWVDSQLLSWMKKREPELPFKVPDSCMLITALGISAERVASGATTLTAFREKMNYDNMTASLTGTHQYEAAGTVFMLDPAASGLDDTSISQIDGAMSVWSHEVYLRSSSNPNLRRVSFDVPVPVKVLDLNVAQRDRRSATSQDVVMQKPLPMLAGHSLAVTWYAAVADALQKGDEERVMYLLNAGLSVPIRMRVLQEDDDCHFASLSFSEAMFSHSAAAGADSFWDFATRANRLTPVRTMISEDLSATKMAQHLKSLGLTFKGKVPSVALATALKGVAMYVLDDGCRAAFAMTEPICPELRDFTLLSRIAAACTARGADAKKSKDFFKFVMESMRAYRLTGDQSKTDKFTVASVINGSDNKKTGQKIAGLIYSYFKRFELVEHVWHEGRLALETGQLDQVAMFRTPADLLREFGASGAGGLVAQHCDDDDSQGARRMEFLFAAQVHGLREKLEPKVQHLLDLAWKTWNGDFTEDIEELLAQEKKQGSSAEGFSWHKHLLGDNSEGELANKYKAFSLALTGGPITAAAATDVGGVPIVQFGTSELTQEEKEERNSTQKQVQVLRRKTVRFTSLPPVGGDAGAEFSPAQLQSVWDKLGTGYKFHRKKGDVRAFVVDAAVFAPNLAKQGAKASLHKPDAMAVDEARLKNVLDFVHSKRHKDDLVLLFDGRSRGNRRQMEKIMDKLDASGAPGFVESTLMYSTPAIEEDHRVPRAQTSFSVNNKEVAFFSLPSNHRRKVVERKDYNNCGEKTSASTSYSGIPMRRLCELPRMSTEVRSSILGGQAAADSLRMKRVQRDIDKKGYPFSLSEVKPVQLWETLLQHHGVTHIVDFTPGSAALAVAAAGSAEYDGIASNDNHRDWLDTIADRCTLYRVSHDEDDFGERLGGDESLSTNAQKYFRGTMEEVRRLLEPLNDEEDDAADDGADIILDSCSDDEEEE